MVSAASRKVKAPLANVLPHEKRLDVLGSLVGGSGMRRASERTGVHRDTIGRFGFAVGVGCDRLHDRLARDVASHFVDMDEQHSWTHKRQKNVDPEHDDVSVMGQRWTWASICRVSRLTIAWHVGKRTAESADVLVSDTRARLSTMPQITTDGLDLYVKPIGNHFGYGVDYAQMIKHEGAGAGKFIERRIIFGAPDMGRVTTYAIERSNLTNRVWNARLIRRTLCFSKRTDRHDASIALGYVYRNLCHKPGNMRETAAMAAGITDHIWSLEELMVVALAEPAGEKPAAQPLTFRVPATTARELPEGRGFLRVVGGAPGAAPTSPATGPAAPVAPKPASAATGAPTVPAVDATGQLDLLAWRPTPREPRQLGLFGD